jgi:hypothetical protein
MATILEFKLPSLEPVHSGRGVRMRILSPAERDEAYALAGELAGKSPTAVRWEILRLRNGVRRALVACTREGNLDDAALEDPATKWDDLSVQKLEETYDDLFTAADDEILAETFKRYHEITKATVDALLGKAKTKRA